MEQVQGKFIGHEFTHSHHLVLALFEYHLLIPIPCSENRGTYRLPLKYAQVIPKVQVQVEIFSVAQYS